LSQILSLIALLSLSFHASGEFPIYVSSVVTTILALLTPGHIALFTAFFAPIVGCFPSRFLLSSAQFSLFTLLYQFLTSFTRLIA